MCGRFSIIHSWEELAGYFRISTQYELPFSPRYNIAPSQSILVLRSASDDSRYPAMLRWGLIPHWAKDEKIGYKMINARSETAAEKPSFKASLRYRRCIIPASSFFEWKKDGKAKLPYNIRLKAHDPLALAGLWDKWKAPTGDIIESCTILTTVSNSLVATLHDRMPVILHPEEIDLWLARDREEVEPLLPLFRPYPSDLMEMYPVSSRVNTPTNDDPECVVPL